MSEHFKPSEFESKDGKPSPWPEVVDRAFILYWRKSGLISASRFISIPATGHQNTIRKLEEYQTPTMLEGRLQTLDRSDTVIRRNGTQPLVV